MKNKDRIILIGGGGHCSSVIDVIGMQGRFIIEGIIDVNEKVGQKISGYSIIGSDNDITRLVREYRFFHITLGFIKSADRRTEIFNILKKSNAGLPVIISPLAYISSTAVVGEGTVVMHMAIVNAKATIGKNCIVNTKALIEHNSVICDHCHIATGAIINGGAYVGEASFVGSGAVTKQGITIPSGTFVKANSIVK